MTRVCRGNPSVDGLAEGAHKGRSHGVISSHLLPLMGEGLPFADSCATKPLPYPWRVDVALRSGAKPDSSAGMLEGWANPDGWV